MRKEWRQFLPPFKTIVLITQRIFKENFYKNKSLSKFIILKTLAFMFGSLFIFYYNKKKPFSVNIPYARVSYDKLVTGSFNGEVTMTLSEYSKFIFNETNSRNKLKLDKIISAVNKQVLNGVTIKYSKVEDSLFIRILFPESNDVYTVFERLAQPVISMRALRVVPLQRFVAVSSFRDLCILYSELYNSSMRELLGAICSKTTISRINKHKKTTKRTYKVTDKKPKKVTEKTVVYLDSYKNRKKEVM